MRISRPLEPILAIALLCCLTGQARAAPLKIGLILGQRNYHSETDAAAINAATQAFLLSRRFTVVERESLDSVFQEKGLKGFIGDSEGAEMSETEGLDWVGILTYTREQVPGSGGGRRTEYVLSLRMVDVRTAQVLYTIDSRPEASDTRYSTATPAPRSNRPWGRWRAWRRWTASTPPANGS